MGIFFPFNVATFTNDNIYFIWFFKIILRSKLNENFTCSQSIFLKRPKISKLWASIVCASKDFPTLFFSLSYFYLCLLSDVPWLWQRWGKREAPRGGCPIKDILSRLSILGAPWMGQMQRLKQEEPQGRLAPEIPLDPGVRVSLALLPGLPTHPGPRHCFCFNSNHIHREE